MSVYDQVEACLDPRFNFDWFGNDLETIPKRNCLSDRCKIQQKQTSTSCETLSPLQTVLSQKDQLFATLKKQRQRHTFCQDAIKTHI